MENGSNGRRRCRQLERGLTPKDVGAVVVGWRAVFMRGKVAMDEWREKR